MLDSDRGIRLIGQGPELTHQVVNGPLRGDSLEIGFEALEGLSLDSDAGPLRPVAHGIASKLDWNPPGVADVFCLRLKERMLPVGGQDEKRPVMPEVLKVCLSRSLPAVAGELRDRYPVFFKNSFIG